jgi:hypothetical protein
MKKIAVILALSAAMTFALPPRDDIPVNPKIKQIKEIILHGIAPSDDVIMDLAGQNIFCYFDESGNLHVLMPPDEYDDAS